MPERTVSSPTAPFDRIGRDARKRYLVLACACDRLELALAWRRPSPPPWQSLTRFVSGNWMQFASAAASIFMPRKIRTAAVLYRLFRSRGDPNKKRTGFFRR